MEIFKSLFGSKSPTFALVKNMCDLKPILMASGVSFEDKPPVQILGVSMERVQMKRGGLMLAVAFGGDYFHIVQVIGLTRALTPKEIVDFNATVQIFSVTPNDEPPSAILKTHVPARFGAIPQTILSLISLSEEATNKLIGIVGATNVREI